MTIQKPTGPDSSLREPRESTRWHTPLPAALLLEKDDRNRSRTGEAGSREHSDLDDSRADSPLFRCRTYVRGVSEDGVSLEDHGTEVRDRRSVVSPAAEALKRGVHQSTAPTQQRGEQKRKRGSKAGFTSNSAAHSRPRSECRKQRHDAYLQEGGRGRTMRSIHHQNSHHCCQNKLNRGKKKKRPTAPRQGNAREGKATQGRRRRDKAVTRFPGGCPPRRE